MPWLKSITKMKARDEVIATVESQVLLKGVQCAEDGVMAFKATFPSLLHGVTRPALPAVCSPTMAAGSWTRAALALRCFQKSWRP